MNKCNHYRTQSQRRYLYNPLTGEACPINITVGVCYGTRERDECTCGGDRSKCNFYPKIREKERKEHTDETI